MLCRSAVSFNVLFCLFFDFRLFIDFFDAIRYNVNG